MDQLRFTGLHEDGSHLVLTAADGSDYLVPVDERLRAALRSAASDSAARSTPATPREVQTRIRAGVSAEEICEDTGWSVERVRRFEGPILAERAHVAGQARAAMVRSHERSTPPPTLEPRARERLAARGVDLEQVSWDATRPDGGQWSVRLRFMAGQRIRHASWTFDPQARTVEAVDDEARWLSEDEQSLPAGGASSALFGGGVDGPDDLMSSVRERSRRRGRGGSGRGQGRRSGARRADASPAGETAAPEEGEEQRAGEQTPQDAGAASELTDDPSAVPGQGNIPLQALPLEDLPYDPDSMGPPPAAGRAASTDADLEETGEQALTGEQDDADEQDDGEDGNPEGNNGNDGNEEGSDLEEDGEEDVELDDSREATLADFFGDIVEDDEDSAEPEDDAADARTPQQEAPEDPEESSAPTRGRKQRKARPSVPSWDDIMFGARDR
ncbi:MAG: septation protein SepH [Ornithinimicrobium sp.]